MTDAAKQALTPEVLGALAAHATEPMLALVVPT